MTDEFYNLTIHSHVGNAEWKVAVDGSTTPSGIISELIEAQNLARTAEGYRLAVKGGDTLLMDETLAAQKVAKDAHLNVLPATKAGSLESRWSGRQSP